MHSGTTQKCSQNILEISTLYGYKFGKLSVAPYLGDLASTLKKPKNLNYDSTTVVATSISNTMLIKTFMNSTVATESLLCEINSYSEHLKKAMVSKDVF